MLKESIRLILAFKKKTKEESLVRAIKIAYIYINKESLYIFKESIRLILAFKKKTREESLVSAIKIAFIYLFNRESLYRQNTTYWEHKNHAFIEPLISILVISYNSGNDLSNLFNSINNQTYKNLEIILVENGTENSSKYLEVLKFPSQYIVSTNI